MQKILFFYWKNVKIPNVPSSASDFTSKFQYLRHRLPKKREIRQNRAIVRGHLAFSENFQKLLNIIGKKAHSATHENSKICWTKCRLQFDGSDVIPLSKFQDYRKGFQRPWLQKHDGDKTRSINPLMQKSYHVFYF